jgi:hypothetical protein
MATTSNDIVIVLSGGSINIDPSLSLGGDPSNSPIPSGVINNLFNDIPADRDGDLEAYRCIYIFNDGDTTIWNLQSWIQQTGEDGSQMEIGIVDTNEIQRITIANTAESGTVTFSYKNVNFILQYTENLPDLVENLQTLLEELVDGSSQPFFRNVTVNGQSTGSLITLDIIWSNKDAKRNFDTIKLVSNNLSPTADVSITVLRQGSPVNTIAVELDAETTVPGNVGFYVASSNSPVTIPRLEPEDGFPLWIKRYVPVEAAAKANDGFSLVIRAQSLET